MSVVTFFCVFVCLHFLQPLCDNEIAKAYIVVKLIMQCKRECLFYSYFFILCPYHTELVFCSLFSCLVQLEWVAAAAGQVPRPSPECPSGPHSVGHLWTWQSCPCWGNHCHPVWQIRVSRILLFVVSYLFLYSSSTKNQESYKNTKT